MNQDIDIIARTLYGEARGEIKKYGVQPLIAIANVIINRYKKNFAKTIKNVCLAPYQFSCWNKNDPNYGKILTVSNSDPTFRKCIAIAENILSNKYQDITNGCDHYHTSNIKPYWAKNLQPQCLFGSHYFYKLK